MNFSLSQRIINNITNEKKLQQTINAKKSVYCGFDPTAPFIHLGNYIQLLNLKKISKSGLKPIVVIGDATGQIGDPSGKSEERNLIDKNTIIKNTKNIKQIIEKILPNATVLFNASWTKEYSFLDFSRKFGKYISISYMLEKEQIRTRLSIDSGKNKGISFTEFSYMLLQAHDFYYLYRNHNCSVQIGGSDQWGNITAGIELIRKIEEDESDACGITFNLLTKEDGTKLGKTEKGTLFIDINEKIPFKMYQYFINQKDSDLETLFLFLTEYSEDNIHKAIKKHFEEPWKRRGQKELCAEVFKNLFSEEQFFLCEKISNKLFKNNFESLSTKDIEAICGTLNVIKINPNCNFVDTLATINTIKSKTEARRLLSAGAIKINGKKVLETDVLSVTQILLKKRFLFVQKGKKDVFLFDVSEKNT